MFTSLFFVFGFPFVVFVELTARINIGFTASVAHSVGFIKYC